MNDNIQVFDLMAAKILERLYLDFPRCINLITENELRNSAEQLSRFKLDSATEGTLYSETLFWLKSNGFIRFAYPTQRPETPTAIPEFSCVELTLDGLKLLKAPAPKTIQNGKTLGDEIAEKFRNGLIREAGKLMADALMNWR